MSAERKISLTKLSEAILPYQASVYVTMLNIIQCIAFGFLIIEGKSMADKDELNFASSLRMAVVFTTILFIWHRYTVDFQYLWPRSFADTIIPFSMGVAECIAVFAVNSKVIFLHDFVGSIMFVQGWAILAYLNAYSKRDKKFMHRLYEDFYQELIFVSYLIDFLKRYNRDHATRMTTAFLGSLIFFVVATLWPSDVVEAIFAAMCMSTLLYRGFFHSFEISIKKDHNLNPYFQGE